MWFWGFNDQVASPDPEEVDRAYLPPVAIRIAELLEASGPGFLDDLVEAFRLQSDERLGTKYRCRLEETWQLAIHLAYRVPPSGLAQYRTDRERWKKLELELELERQRTEIPELTDTGRNILRTVAESDTPSKGKSVAKECGCADGTAKRYLAEFIKIGLVMKRKRPTRFLPPPGPALPDRDNGAQEVQTCPNARRSALASIGLGKRSTISSESFRQAA
jgi:hypothetical protein